MLNLITNTSASTAQRNLATTNDSLKRSLEKLSSGYRVNRASDDVASMAIGSRLNSELTALKTVAVNTGQAVSLLQIAEGTYSRINDMLVRLKSLAAQAANGTLSNTERSLLDVEFSAIIDEIDRVSNDTAFNSTKVVAGGQTTTNAAVAEATVSFLGIMGDGATSQAAMDITIVGGAGAAKVFSANFAGEGFSSNNTNGVGLAATYLTGGDLTTEAVTVVLTNTAGDKAIVANILSGANVAAAGGLDVDIGLTSDANLDGDTDFNFRVGTGSNSAEDVIAAAIRATTAKSLGLKSKGTTAVNISIASVQRADSASSIVDVAINYIIDARARVGAVQNRIETAAVNLATTIENTEAAKSSYLDADIAAEITQFTAKQILLQSGISTLAQANQVPQNLLALFQQ